MVGVWHSVRRLQLRRRTILHSSRVVPGRFLADIYLEYGSRLLEGNVRSFLKNRGKCKQGYFRTILQEPSMFFAYNNGIAATATEIETTQIDGKNLITRIKDMQIIN